MAEPIPPSTRNAPSIVNPPVVTMHPVPTEDEAAAIVAALMLVSSGGDSVAEQARPDGSWRFSGRWWSRPVPMARQRPWRG